MRYLGAISKRTEWFSVHFQGKPFNITVIQVYAPTCNAEKAEVEEFYEDLQDLLELAPKQDVLFILGNWNEKVGSQEIPGVTGKFGLGEWRRAKANRVLPRECTSHSKHHLPATQETILHMDITRCSTLNQIDYILCSQRWRSSIESTKTRLGADRGSDHELFIVKFTLKLKKVGKITRSFRYDLHQIPYDYTVEVTNRFKGLNLIVCLMNYGCRFVTLYRRQ